MFRLAAFDLVLGRVWAGMMGVTLTDEIPLVYACDGPADPPGLRVPTDFIADLKRRHHDELPQCLTAFRNARSMCQKRASVVL